MLEGERFAEEPTGYGDSLRIGTPVREAELSILLRSARTHDTDGKEGYLSNALEPLGSGDIPLPPLRDLCKDPRLDQCPSSNHDPIHPARLLLLVVSLRREAVAASKERNWRETGIGEGRPDDLGTFADVSPVGQLGVTLLSRAAVQLMNKSQLQWEAQLGYDTQS